ncbi:hypothetical protein [Ensifer soli]|uniref:hypothetical protein n=1 Tax=Ciceribacter sp. sgz301302 TaxID=3342379 RepID=UPI0035B8B48C
MKKKKYGKLFKAVTALSIVLLFMLFTMSVWSLATDNALKSAYNDIISRENLAIDTRKIDEECSKRKIIDIVTCVNEKILSSIDYKNSERDLRAQEGMEFWAKGMFLLSVASLILTGAGLYYIKKTFNATREAARSSEAHANDAIRTSKQAERAFVSYSNHQTIANNNLNDDAETLLFVTVKNTGRSVASGLHVTLCCRVIEVAKYPQSLVLFNHDWSHSTILCPNAECESPVYPFKNSTIKSIMSGEHYGVAAIKIKYKDNFSGETHLIEQKFRISFLKTSINKNNIYDKTYFQPLGESKIDIYNEEERYRELAGEY